MARLRPAFRVPVRPALFDGAARSLTSPVLLLVEKCFRRSEWLPRHRWLPLSENGRSMSKDPLATIRKVHRASVNSPRWCHAGRRGRGVVAESTEAGKFLAARRVAGRKTKTSRSPEHPDGGTSGGYRPRWHGLRAGAGRGFPAAGRTNRLWQGISGGRGTAAGSSVAPRGGFRSCLQGVRAAFAGAHAHDGVERH